MPEEKPADQAGEWLDEEAKEELSVIAKDLAEYDKTLIEALQLLDALLATP